MKFIVTVTTTATYSQDIVMDDADYDEPLTKFEILKLAKRQNEERYVRGGGKDAHLHTNVSLDVQDEVILTLRQERGDVDNWTPEDIQIVCADLSPEKGLRDLVESMEYFVKGQKQLKEQGQSEQTSTEHLAQRGVRNDR